MNGNPKSRPPPFGACPFGFAVGLVITVSVALSCTEPLEEDLFEGWSRIRAEPAEPDAKWEAVFIREYGSLSGEISFGILTEATVLSDGSLVVVDITDCSLVVINRPAGTLRTKLGGCGQGPGEFTQGIRTLESVADSILVYDQGRGHIVVLDPDGLETRQIPVTIPGERLGTLSHLEVLDDSTLLVAREFAGSATVETMDRTTGERRDVFVRTSTRVFDENMIRHLAACAEPTRATPTIVALNEWFFEGLGIHAESKGERFHFLTSVANLRDDEEIGITSSDVRCGESFALFRGTTPGGSATMTADGFIIQRAGAVVLEARAYDGSLRMRNIVVDKGSLMRGALGGIRGDTVFFLSNSARDYPVVSEFVVGLGN